MKKIFALLILMVSVAAGLPSSSDAATGKDKDFVDAYKKAYESKDEKTLKSFLYTKGADPMILEFYTMMMTAEMGGKIEKIDLVDLTPADQKKVNEMQPLPNGELAKLPLTPTKKLVLNIKTESPNGTSTSTSESFVAIHEGKYWIPVPGPVK